MQRKASYIFTLVLFFCCSAFAQSTFEISGTVFDAVTGETIIGATVYSKNLAKGDASTLDGHYAIKSIAPNQKVDLHVSYPGFIALDTVLSVNSASIQLDIKLFTKTELEEVVISGKLNGESEESAKSREKNALNIINVISAKAIQLSPDITVANVLQRVSGVSIERSSNGDGRYAIIRGMDQRYNYTLINGIKIPSPDNKNRYVPLDIFPADMVEKVEVNKTLTPAMEGDAIGGTVNMIMKNAPEKPYLNVSASTGYSQMLLDRKFDYYPEGAINLKSPYEQHGAAYLAQPTDFTRDNLNFTKKSFTPNKLASVSAGNRFFNNKLGVMVTGSYQNLYKGYSSDFNTVEPQADGTVYVKNAYTRTYSTHLVRSGLNLKSDYRISENHTISLYALYCKLDEAQTRFSNDTIQTAPRTGLGTGQIWYYERARYQTQSIGNITLQGKHFFLDKHLEFTWSGVTSLATNRIPDWAEIEYDGGYYVDPSKPGTDPYTHTNVLQNFNRTWWHNTDRDYTGYADLKYNNEVKGIPYTLTVGGMHRDKHRDNTYDNYELRPVPLANGQKPEWSGIYNFDWTVYNPAGSDASASNYRANERITAYYGMLQFQLRRISFTGGVRQETTSQDFETNVPETQAGKTGSIDYTDLLPSVSVKYSLNNKTNLRASYFASLSRPGFYEIVPYKMLNENWTDRGNPYVKHTTADNYDLRYELFPRSNEQILVGAFYKRINNPIEYGFVFTGIGNDTYYQPLNFGTATNYGLELVYEKYYRNFGIRANYTYTKSSITTNKYVFGYENGQPTRDSVAQNRPLQGQASHVANIALLYKNTKKGIDAQITWQYTGKRIILVQPYYNCDYWQQPMSIFDFSAEKTFGKHFTVFTKIQNLFNANYLVYMNQTLSNEYPVSNNTSAPDGKALVQKENYGQTYQLGFRYNL